MQRGDELGQIRAGYLADLLIVDGNPLADIRILQDPNRIEAVMVGGRFTKNRMSPAAQKRQAPAERQVAIAV